jgi:hypothetical protein
MRGVSAVLGGCFLIASCDVTQTTPARAERFQLCSPPQAVIDAARQIAEQNELGFFFGTHRTSFGTSVAIRMMSSEFEVELINIEEENLYQISLYPIEPRTMTVRGIQVLQIVKGQLDSEVGCNRPPDPAS